MLRRHFAQNTLALCALAMAWGRAGAQAAFPSKTVRIVVPNGPGGAADLTARAVGQQLALALGQSVVVDNKPGAGGIVAAETVARAAPDGHTLLLISSGTAVSQALFKSLPFDAQKDFAPVALLATFDLGVVVSQGSRFNTLADLLAYGRANPGKLTIGTPNIGTTQHLAAVLLTQAAGLNAQIVPFNGTPPVLTALRGGQIDVALDILGPLLPQIQAKALRALAVTGDKRSRWLPQVPSAREVGVAGFAVASWNGLAVPAKTPNAVIQRLNHEVQSALALPQLKTSLESMNLEPHTGAPEQAAELLARDIARWRELIAQAHIERQ